MKTIKISFFMFIIILITMVFQSCEKYLNEEVYSQLAPGNFLTTQNGIESVLGAAYAEASLNAWNGHSIRNLEEWTTDIEWETGGGENRTAVLMINFTWDANTDWINRLLWKQPYRGIRNANIVLENIDNVTDIGDNDKELYKAEAKFVRATLYTYLYSWFGPTVLRKNTTDPLEMQRCTEEEMKSFIETEFKDVIPVLPEPGQEAAYGRANKGAARAYLCKFYLNTKQWQKCADMAKEIIDMHYYELYPSYVDLFRVENEINKEFIWVDPCIALSGSGNFYIAGAFPPGFAKDPWKTGAVFTVNMRNWAAQYRIYDSFYNSFETGDQRQQLLIDKYINNNGDTISLIGQNNIRSFKYIPDPNAIANDQGNDIVEMRYTDILLSRAEALNELNGPNQESIDLINQVRNRAGLPNLDLANFASKDDLRDHILKERGWEFYTERKRREDLIRMGKFIEYAQARGVTNAQSYRVRYPIPQPEMDANSEMTQNIGY